MKNLVFISVIILLTNICCAQQNTFNKEAELQKFVEQGGKVEETALNIYKLTYRDGTQRVFNFKTKTNQNSFIEGIDTTIINIWEIDTTKYNNVFVYWQTVQIANSYWLPVFVDDLNNDGMPELYGYSDYDNRPIYDGGPIKIFERNGNNEFENVFTYDSATIFVQAMGDVRGTGGRDLYARTRMSNNGAVYRSDTVGTFPGIFDFVFYYEPNQINDMTFGDFDQNGITDCAFVDMNTPSKIIIGEFREDINNFITSFEHVTPLDVPSGFAINDYNRDGKIELAIGTGEGNILVVENIDTNNYKLTWQSQFSTYNAYMKTNSNDIDGNGKKEFWIGGQDFENGITRFQCYESNADNSYDKVAMIELRFINSFSANHIQAIDIDLDGNEELIISIARTILVLKFVGNPNEHRYKICYARIGEPAHPVAVMFPAAIADFNGDEKKDILVSFEENQGSTAFAFSYILTQENTSNVEIIQERDISVYNLNSSPTPFNSTAKINFNTVISEKIIIKIFDILGNEIKTLLEEYVPPGKYTIDWNGTGKNNTYLPSGVYLITLLSRSGVKTIKTVLLK